MRDFEEESFDDEPSEDDWKTSDHATFYADGKRVLSISRDASEKEMWKAIDKEMNQQKFWPNVWFISDHGNAHLMERPQSARKRPRR